MSRYAHAVYCDDIRQEIGGKFTLVGIYAGQVLVPAIPCALPKLCLCLNVSATREAPIEAVTVIGVFAGTEVIKMDLDKDQIQQIMAPSTAARPDAKNMMLMLMGVMAPFNVLTTGKLTLTVIADGEELYCEGLEISVATGDVQYGF